jgi:hypothetical protein
VVVGGEVPVSVELGDRQDASPAQSLRRGLGREDALLIQDGHFHRLWLQLVSDDLQPENLRGAQLITGELRE